MPDALVACLNSSDSIGCVQSVDDQKWGICRSAFYALLPDYNGDEERER